MQAMTKHELENSGENLTLGYGRAESPFGTVLAANTHKGICFLIFVDGETDDRAEIHRLFPNAKLSRMDHYFQELINCAFTPCPKDCDKVKLHVIATPFQMRVWKALLDIPFGRTRTYGQIARSIGDPNASRAVGSAVGSNNVAFLIPCHRVIKADGDTGKFKWGAELKKHILNWEKAIIIVYQVQYSDFIRFGIDGIKMGLREGEGRYPFPSDVLRSAAETQ